MRSGIIAVGLMLAACSGSHDKGATPTQPFDPFATKGPSTSQAAAPPVTPTLPAPPPVDVGQCFDTDHFAAGTAIDLSSARVVDCAGPHQHEVYAIVGQTAGPGAPYPGDVVLAAFADDRCLAAFTPYTGVDYRASQYDIANARPDQAAWDRGERRVICALHDADFAELTGSAKSTPG
jgi:hypothetical protein